MIEILDTTSQRMINLLNLLYYSTQWQTVGNMAKCLEVSEKTINEDLKIIKERWPHLIEIETSFVYGVKAHQVSTSNLLTIFSEIAREDTSIKWLELLFRFPYKTLSYYAKLLHVSDSTLNRVLTRMNKVFVPYSLKIERHLSLYFISSQDEFLCRFILTCLFIEVSSHNIVQLMSINQFSSIKKRLQQTVLTSSQKKNELQLYFAVTLNYLSFIREQQGFSLPPKKSVKKKTLPDEYYDFCKTEFSNLTPTAILTVEESLRLHKSKQLANKQTVKQLKQFTNSLFSELRISHLKKEQLLFNHLLLDLYVNQINYGLPFWVLFNRFSYFATQLERENPTFFNQLKKRIATLSQTTACDFLSVFDFILYGLVTLVPQLLVFITEQSILVVSDFSLQHAQFLGTVISQSLSLNNDTGLTVHHTKYNLLAEHDLSQYRFIVSNRSLNNSEVDSILIDDYPSEIMLIAISKKINASLPQKKNSP